MQATAVEAVEENDDMYRRALIQGTMLSAGAGISAAALDLIERMRCDLDQVLGCSSALTNDAASWEQRAADYASAYQTVPPTTLLCDVLADFQGVRLALGRAQSVEVRSRLCHVAAQFAGLSGIFLSALGQYRQARDWFQTGQRAANETSHRELTGWLLARSAVVSLYYGSPRSALSLADDALRHLPKRATATAARTHVIRARALARLSDKPGAEAALESARAVFGPLDSEATRDTAFGYTERQFLAHTGNALARLGDTRRAYDAQDQALALYPSAERLDPVLLRFDRAYCLVRDNDISSAFALATTALGELPNAHRTGMVQAYANDFLDGVPAVERRSVAGRQFAEAMRESFPA